MRPGISGFMRIGPRNANTKMKISQELLGVVRDCKLFRGEKRWPDLLSIITSADRPATSAKSAIFDRNDKKVEKKSQKDDFFY